MDIGRIDRSGAILNGRSSSVLMGLAIGCGFALIACYFPRLNGWQKAITVGGASLLGGAVGYCLGARDGQGVGRPLGDAPGDPAAALGGANQVAAGIASDRVAPQLRPELENRDTRLAVMFRMASTFQIGSWRHGERRDGEPDDPHYQEFLSWLRASRDNMWKQGYRMGGHLLSMVSLQDTRVHAYLEMCCTGIESIPYTSDSPVYQINESLIRALMEVVAASTSTIDDRRAALGLLENLSNPVTRQLYNELIPQVAGYAHARASLAVPQR
jgi:hypothetical protein